MQKNTLVTMIIGVTVAVIMAAAVLVPVVSSASTTTFTNSPNSEKYVYADDEPVTFAYDASTGVYTVNGVVTSHMNANYATIAADTFSLRWASNSPMLYIKASDGSGTAYGVSTTGFTLTAQNGTATARVGDATVTAAYTYLWYQKADGDHVMSFGDSAFYLRSGDEVHCTGFNTALGSNWAKRVFTMTGSVEDGFTLTSFDGSVSLTPTAVDMEKLDGYTEDVYKVTSIEFEYNDSTITINRLVVPMSFTVEKDGSAWGILGVIPVLVITAVLVGVVAASVRRDEA